MIPDDNLILTGFMGTGKSTLGPLLAERWDRGFVDLDRWIEEQVGESIAALFASKGEDEFRAWEMRVCLAFRRPQRLVLSTGGGTLLDPVRRGLLKEGGRILCLTASFACLQQRLQGDQTRPLLRGDWQTLFEERKPVYAQFPQLDTTNRTPDSLVQEIEKRWPTL
jgi:shikimate kinase